MESDDVKVAVGRYLDLVVNGRGDERENVEGLRPVRGGLALPEHE